MKTNHASPVTIASDQPPTMMASLRALPPAAWILFFGTFLNKFGTFVIPFLTLYLTGQGYSYTQAGMAIGAYGVGNLVASMLGGYLADRIGRRSTIVLSMFSGAVAMLCLSQARGFWMIVSLSALTGLTSELYRPAASALLTDLIPNGKRVTAFAAYRMAFNAGWAFGPATAGFLATKGYFWLFIGDAATSLLFGIVALIALPAGGHSQKPESGWSDALSTLRKDTALHHVLLAAFAIGLIFFQTSSTFGLYVTQLGFSAAVYGAVISLNGALIVLFELPITSLTQRYQARHVMAVGNALIGIGFALNVFATTIPALVFCMVILTLGEMIAMPVSSAFIADLAPSHMRGRYMGAFGFTWATALTVGPPMGMKLYGWGPAALFLFCGILGLCAAMSVLRTRPKCE
jgi:MFS family permease